jgi:hypothetical protein
VGTGTATHVASAEVVDGAAPTREPRSSARGHGTPGARVLALQRQAGNRAITTLLQRDKAPPRTAARKPVGSHPWVVKPGELATWADNMNTAYGHLWTKQILPGHENKAALTADDFFRVKVQVAYIETADALFEFDDTGDLEKVSENSSPPATDEIVVASLDSTAEYQVYWRDDGFVQLVARNGAPPPASGAALDAVLYVRAAGTDSSKVQGLQRPGWSRTPDPTIPDSGTAGGGGGGEKTTEPPKPASSETSAPVWAAAQVDRVFKILSGHPPPSSGKDGGTEAPPIDIDPAAVPDRLVPWANDKGVWVNVWKDGTAVAVKVKEGDPDGAVAGKIAAAAKQQSSAGFRMRGSGTGTGTREHKAPQQPRGTGEAAAVVHAAAGRGKPPKPKPEPQSEPEYPADIKLLDGAGALSSPAGWGTTIAGGDNVFRMALDWDRYQFGLANQTIARLGTVKYRWQLFNVTEGYHTTAEEAAKAAEEKAGPNSDTSKDLSHNTMGSTRRTAERASEELKEEREGDSSWPIKAAKMSAAGASAVWDIAGSAVSELIENFLRPQSEWKIGVADPGDYIVRCLATPIGDEDKPDDQQVRRTSVAGFPLRVRDVTTRAIEVNTSEEADIASAEKVLATKRAALAKAPGDAALDAEVKLKELALAAMKKEAARDTSTRMADELADLDADHDALIYLHENTTDQVTDGKILMAMRRIVDVEGLTTPKQWEQRFEQVKKAKEARGKQAKQLSSWKADRLKAGNELRPKVTFVSEDNGAAIPMDMVLGEDVDSKPGSPKWTLLDVTTSETQGHYEGAGSGAGEEGHRTAIAQAFEAYRQKAEYGPGTLAVALPPIAQAGTTPAVPTILLMRPGTKQRWKHRLGNLVQMATLAAPFVRGGKALATIAGVAGGIDALDNLHDRASNDKLKANFQTLNDIMGVLGPVLEGMKAMAALPALSKGRAAVVGSTMHVLVTVGDEVQKYLLPASVLHDIDGVLGNDELRPDQKQAAIAGILGRGLRDGTLHLVAPKHHDEPTPDTDGHGDTGGAGGGHIPVVGGDGGAKPTPQQAAATHALRGLSPESVAKLQKFATDNHLYIDARPPAASAAGWIDKGAVPKPESIKAKTINEADRLLGAPPDSMGLVGYFEPHLPDKPASMSDGDWATVERRFHERTIEHSDLHDEMEAMKADGSITVENGVVKLKAKDGQTGAEVYKAITGDLDLWDIHNADPHGPALDAAAIHRITDQLKALGVTVEHGPHLWWEPKPGKEAKVFGDIVKAHNPKGGKPLVRFGPDEPPTVVDGDTAPPVKPAPGGKKAAMPDPATATTSDGRNVKVKNGAIEVCPVQRCPSAAATVGGAIEDPEVARLLHLAAAEAGAGRDGRAARLAKRAVELADHYEGRQGRPAGPLTPTAEANVRLVAAERKKSSDPEVHEALDEVEAGARGGAPREQVEAQLARVPALAEIRAQRRLWEADPDPAKALAAKTLDNVELLLRQGKITAEKALEHVRTARKELGVQVTGDPGAGPSLRSGLAARDPDVAKHFADSKMGARFDAAMAELERAGLGAEGRALVDSLFDPAGNRKKVSRTHFDEAVGTVIHLAGLLRQRPDLASATGQARSRAALVDLAGKVVGAYRKGQTLDGRPLRDPADADLRAVMGDLDNAFVAQKAATGGDPVTRLKALLDLHEKVVRAGETLRVHDPRFRVTENIVGAARDGTFLPGTQEHDISVRATGSPGEPLSRDLPGVGFEKEHLTPTNIADLKTDPPGLAQELADRVPGYQRAHLIGPGFGGELREGLMLAPEHVNQVLQNRYVEDFIRTAQGAGVDMTVTTTAQGRRIDVPLEGGGTRAIDILRSVEYQIAGTIDGKQAIFTVRIEVPDTPGATPKMTTNLPPQFTIKKGRIGKKR